MFLRKNRKSANGEVYEYWTLCETVRAERGPRQLLLEKVKDTPTPPSSEQWELASLAALSIGRVREFGSVYLALALWRPLDRKTDRVEAQLLKRGTLGGLCHF